MNRIEFVLTLIFTFFVIVVWITSEVILAKPTVPEDPKTQTMIEPLNPQFDTKTIQLINNTKQVPLMKATPPKPIGTPQPSPTALTTPTPSVSIVAPSPTTSPTATTILPENDTTNTAASPLTDAETETVP